MPRCSQMMMFPGVIDEGEVGAKPFVTDTFEKCEYLSFSLGGLNP
jgi:hypothetical protein